MLADATAQDDHPCLFRPSCLFVDLTDVARDVNDQSWAAERVEIDHVSDGTVCQRRTEDGDVVLRVGSVVGDRVNGWQITLYAQ